MNSILYDIYSGGYDAIPAPDQKQRELDKKLYAEWDKVQTMFGDVFVDRLLELEGEREDWRAFRYYREGFRLGGLLMLEILTSATE